MVYVDVGEVVVAERTSVTTEAEFVRAAPADAAPMQSGHRGFLPRRVLLRYTNHHDGQGWQWLHGIVSGPWILTNGAISRRAAHAVIDLGTEQPDWLRVMIATHLPPDPFDIEKAHG